MVRRAMARYAYEPDYAVQPGATLLETIEVQGIAQKELAQRTGFTEKHISQIIRGKAPISPGAAIRFERVTGVPAHLWNALEAKYQERLARQEANERLEADLEWLECIPVKELMKREAIVESKDRIAVLDSVLHFFGVASVEAWRTGWDTPEFAFRKSTAHASQTGALAAWLRQGEIEAASRACQPYDPKRFRANLDVIRSLTVTDPQVFVPQMIASCAEAGVALALVPEIKGAPVSGAAKWLTSTKGMICMNLRGKANDRFWFTFFHEAGHLLNDSKREVFVDVNYLDDPHERTANEFACHLLIPARYDTTLSALRSEAEVVKFAARIGIHPGIVVGRLQREEIVPYSHLNKLKAKLEWSHK